EGAAAVGLQAVRDADEGDGAGFEETLHPAAAPCGALAGPPGAAVLLVGSHGSTLSMGLRAPPRRPPRPPAARRQRPATSRRRRAGRPPRSGRSGAAPGGTPPP